MLCYTVCISIVMFVKEIILPEKFNDFHMIVTVTVMLMVMVMVVVMVVVVVMVMVMVVRRHYFKPSFQLPNIILAAAVIILITRHSKTIISITKYYPGSRRHHFNY